MMDIGGYRNIEFHFDSVEFREAGTETGAACGSNTGAVGLIETGFEDEWQFELCTEIAQRLRDEVIGP